MAYFIFFMLLGSFSAYYTLYFWVVKPIREKRVRCRRLFRDPGLCYYVTRDAQPRQYWALIAANILQAIMTTGGMLIIAMAMFHEGEDSLLEYLYRAFAL